jgi:hypothetical protein
MFEEQENAYRILVGKSEGRIRLGRCRRNGEDNIRKGLKEVRSRAWTG